MKNRIVRRAFTALCICSLTAGLVGCSKQVDNKGAKATEEPAKQVDYNEDENSNLGPWARAMGSVLIFLNDGNPYYFGGYLITEDNKNGAANILSASWDIGSREDLLVQIQNLLAEGDRVAFRKEAKEMNAMSKKQLKTAMKQLSGDLLLHYELVQYNWEKWGSKGLLAWDMCRISHLVQWGYVAGYLSREEAQALIEPAARRLQKDFTSWEEVQNNWLDGFCLFAGIDPETSNTDYTNRKSLYERLVKAEDGHKDKMLYDDTLFTEDITVISGVSYKTILKEGVNGKKKTNSKKKA